MPIETDPAKIRLTPGKMLVEIIEQLGAKTKGGLWRVGYVEANRSDRDTVKVKVIRMGPMPFLFHPAAESTPHAHNRITKPSSEPWPRDYVPFGEESIVLLPRDVPLVVIHDNKRFAIANIDEVILVLADETVEIDTTRS